MLHHHIITASVAKHERQRLDKM